MQKVIIITGVFILLIGLFWPVLGKIPLGRLPGDIFINRPGMKVYIPITSMIVVSIVVSIIMWFFRK